VGEKEPSHTTGGNVLQTPWKTLWSLLKKLKIDLPYDLAIPMGLDGAWSPEAVRREPD
jgi:hypothetical protein